RTVAPPHAIATAVVTVTAVPQTIVTITPGQLTLDPGQSGNFIADVTGAANGVTWSVMEVGGGTIDTSGNYTAPTLAGTAHAIATSTADPSKMSIALVTVRLDLTLSPTTAQLNPGQHQTFLTTVAGSTDRAVTFSVQEGSAGGSIDSNGNYTAP